MSFFDPFTAQDWVTFVLAALALVVSAGSLIQNHFFRPRPHFEMQWAKEAMEDPSGVVIGICRFWNDGDATARNVRLNVKGKGIVCRIDHWDHWDEFPPGERHGFEVPLEPAVRDWVSMSEKGILRVESTPDPALRGRRPKRDEYLRPVVSIKYRGRWRKVTSKAPPIEDLEMVPAGGAC